MYDELHDKYSALLSHVNMYDSVRERKPRAKNKYVINIGRWFTWKNAAEK